MKCTFTRALLTCVLAAVSAVPLVIADTKIEGSAQLQASVGSVISGGNAQITVNQGNLIGAALGTGLINEIAVGHVKNSATGDVKINVVAGDVLSITLGAGRRGRVKIGTVTNSAVGSVRLNVATGSVVNVSAGVGSFGTRGEVLIGTIGD